MKYLRFALYIIIIVGGIIFVSSRANVFTLHDYIEYWSAARLNLSGQNPYSPELIFALEKINGWTDSVPLMMWNPPFSLAFILPFALLPYSLSRLAWFFASLAVVLGYSSYAWTIYGGKQAQRWIPWILTISFGPILQMLKLGQIVPVGLIGLLGFQYFFSKKNYLAAGICASLTLSKPHLFYLVWLCLVLWSLRQRQWQFWAGVSVGLLSALIPAWITNPDLLAQYMSALQNYPPEEWVTATLGSALRLTFGPEHFWLQFLPSVVGGVFFSAYWWLRRKIWNWENELPFLIMASVATAAYGWVFDLSICLIGLIEQGTKIFQSKPTKLLIALYLIYLAINVILGFVSMPQYLFGWAGLTLVALYIVTRWALNKLPSQNTL